MEHETDLIRQILLGHRALFEEIVLTYQHLVFSVCVAIVKDEYDAENIAQETFLAAYGALRDFRGGSFKSWLCRIAVNKSIDYKRKRARLLFEELGESARQDGESVEEGFERQQRKEKVVRLLVALPDKYADVVKAFYYSQLTVKEIARRMELPERTVETRLYRAKKLMRERWEEDGA